MGKQADAVVAELQRNERKRRIATALAIMIVFGAMTSTFLIHSWVLRLAIACVSMLVVLVLASIASRTLDPFTMENATRARLTGVASAKAEAAAEKRDDLFETEAAATKVEAKRDEA